MTPLAKPQKRVNRRIGLAGIDGSPDDLGAFDECREIGKSLGPAPAGNHE
jgi:hypothetical protein